MGNLVSNLAENQIIIENRENGKKEFHSYSSKIAEINEGKIYLSTDKWNFSRTTTKYLCQFLGVKNKKAIEAGIKENEYILTKF